MRVIQTNKFSIGSKLGYSEYPDIVRQFLEGQGLQAQSFLYYFHELAIPLLKPYEQTIQSGACVKAQKACPALGEIHTFRHPGNTGKAMPGLSDLHTLYLSNILSKTDCTWEDVLPHMKKIHRTFGFVQSDLYFYDIDFFGDVIPWERDTSHMESYCKQVNSEPVPPLFLADQPYGSGFRLHRYSTGGNFISLSIDLLHNGEIRDASPYFDALKALLPKNNPHISMQIYLTDEEKAEIEAWNQKIAPVLESARSFLSECFPGRDRQNLSATKYTIETKLKKLGKLRGYSCHYEGDGMWRLDKRTSRGHALCLTAESGPSRCSTGYAVTLQGPGFRHSLLYSMQTPGNQEESDACTEKIFAVLDEFEEKFAPELDRYYAETPEWFISSAW